MKLRDFLTFTAGLAGLLTVAVAYAQTKPCPPSFVSVNGGSSAQTACVAGTSAADWLARSTAEGVIAAYDFSSPPANGGTWKWGSLKPGITVYAYKYAQIPSARTVDTSIAPPGSSASLRFDVPAGTAERSDNWNISIDNYADQIGENDEVWVQWRQRMNSTYATTGFNKAGGGYTTFKLVMLNEGMQPDPMPFGTVHQYYGYEGPGTDSNNTISDVRFCSENEIVMQGRHPGGTPQYKYPRMYHGCSFFVPFVTQAGNDYTDRNEGLANPTNCLYNGGTGALYNPSSCFLFVPDQWMTFMVHVITGPSGTGTSQLGGGVQSGFLNSTIEYYGGYQGQPVQLLHRITGVVIRRGNSPDSLGFSATQKLGMFGFTTFMTQKDSAQNHPLAQTWFSQIVISRKRIPDPSN